jgi:hypothetical protein
MCVRILYRDSNLSLASWNKGCFSRSLMSEKTIPIFDPACGAAKEPSSRGEKSPLHLVRQPRFRHFYSKFRWPRFHNLHRSKGSKMMPVEVRHDADEAWKSNP